MITDKKLKKIELIITRLIAATKAGKLRWQPVDDVFGVQRFKTSIGLNDVCVVHGNEPDPSYANLDPYATRVEILNGAGNIIATYTADQGLSKGPVKELFNLARGQALNVEEAIDAIIGYLEETSL